jgi:hypothetical protein
VGSLRVPKYLELRKPVTLMRHRKLGWVGGNLNVQELDSLQPSVYTSSKAPRSQPETLNRST